MNNILLFMATLPLLLSGAFAADSSINCRTDLGTRSLARVPTTTVTQPNSIRPTRTIIMQSTVTSRVGFISTSTKTKTKTETTTDTTITDTFHTTTTLFDVETITNEATVTSTTTETSTTSSTSTSIVPTTAGFKNIRDTLNSDALRRRAIDHPHAKRAVQSGVQGVLAATFPAKVTCTKTAAPSTKTVYTTLRPATVTVPFWRLTTIETTTQTTTSTIIPDNVSTTETETSTSSVTTFTTTFTTEISTTSTTTTSILPGPTLYDACKPENIWGPNFRHSNVNYYATNVANNGPGVASDFKIMADGASTAVDCCAACQQFGTCETYIFRSRNRNCFLLSHDGAKCLSQANHPNFILSKAGSDTGAGYVVGNGNCGYTYSGNSDGSVWPVDL